MRGEQYAILGLAEKRCRTDSCATEEMTRRYASMGLIISLLPPPSQY